MGADYLSILGITPGMSAMKRVTDPRTLGPCFHTADQADQRLYLGSGFDGDRAFDADAARRPVVGDNRAPGFANAVRTVRHADGTCDAVRLDATADGWIDYGGATPRDMKVVNW